MDFAPLRRFMDSLVPYGIPSAEVSVMRNHEELFRYRSGWRDRENNIPLQGDELYYMYSCSKVITVTAAMQLFEKGMFLLDDPVYEYLPEFRYISVKDLDGHIRDAQKMMTVRHLFTMTAGLNYDINDPVLQETIKTTDGKAPTREVIKAFAKIPLSFEPGEQWQYSFCHDVLAGLVEVIAGQRFSEYVKEHVFEPLGMKNSCYHDDVDIRNRMAEIYYYDDNLGTAVHRSKNSASFILGPDYDSGGAGVISCVDDYRLFTDAMANGGIGVTGERIISNAAIDLMRMNQLNEQQMKSLNRQRLSGYGYGLGVRTVVDRSKGVLSPVGEFGWSGAAGSYVLIDPMNKVSIFYAQHMTNNKEAYVHPRIRNIVYGCL